LKPLDDKTKKLVFGVAMLALALALALGMFLARVLRP